MLKLQKVFEVSVPPPNGGLVYYYNRNKNQDIKTYVFPLLFSFPAPAADTQTSATLCCSRLLVCLRLLVVLADLEVTQLVRLLVRRHHSKPVTQVVLLQVLFCKVLQIPVGKAIVFSFAGFY